jgi:hypothetical protein
MVSSKQKEQEFTQRAQSKNTEGTEREAVSCQLERVTYDLLLKNCS